MKLLKIFILSVSLSLVSSIPLQEARTHDDDQEILEMLDNYIEGSPRDPDDKFPDNIDGSIPGNPGLHHSPDMSLEDTIHAESSDNAKNLVPDRSEPFFKLLESGFMDRPQRYMPRGPLRKHYALVPMTRGGTNDVQEQILDNNVMATLGRLKEILSSAINYLRNQNRRRNWNPEENREAASDPRQDRTRNFLDMVGNHFQRGGSDGEGSKDVEMERVGLGKLVNIILRILRKFPRRG